MLNNENHTRFVDPNIVHFSEEELGLAICVSRFTYTFAIHHIQQSRLLAFCQILLDDQLEYSQALELVFEQEPLLDFRYKQVRLLAENFKSTLLPTVYFQEERAWDYVKTNFPIHPQSEELFTEEFSTEKTQILTLVHKKLLQNISEKYPESQFFSAYYVLLSAFKKNIDKDKKHKHQVFIHFREHIFDLVVFEHGKLLFINSFAFKNQHELLYYFLYVLNKLKVDLGAVDLKICGLQPVYTIDLLTSYVFNISIADPPTGILNNLGITPSSYYLLFNLLSCELSAEH